MFGDIRLDIKHDLKEGDDWVYIVECLKCHKDIRIAGINHKIDITDHCECGRSNEFKSNLIRHIRHSLKASYEKWI